MSPTQLWLSNIFAKSRLLTSYISFIPFHFLCLGFCLLGLLSGAAVKCYNCFANVASLEKMFTDIVYTVSTG